MRTDPPAFFRSVETLALFAMIFSRSSLSRSSQQNLSSSSRLFRNR